jgi:hypothetical protein
MVAECVANRLQQAANLFITKEFTLAKNHIVAARNAGIRRV